ncbi:MAG: nucleotidyltransferase family protein [Lewinellaceae bacterium]|nr:nucleotidyltransferase family protein [Lewinellaceae bacterium]
MATRTSILRFLRNHKAYLQQQLGVKAIGIFGSYARNVAGPSSDVDILVEQSQPSYQKYVELRLFLEQHLHTPVDLVRRGPHLRKSFLDSIEQDLVYA